MATTELGTTYSHDELMEKLRIRNGQIEAAPLTPSLSDDAEVVSDDDGIGSEVAEAAPESTDPSTNPIPVPDLRRNFIIPPRERALECIAVLLNLARHNLGISQRNLHAARNAQKEKELAHWKWESLHWLRRCGKWSNHKRKVEARP